MITFSGLLNLFLVCVALSSAAIPLGGAYLKFDWLGVMLVCAAGFFRLGLTGKLDALAVKFTAAFLLYLLLNGLIAFLSGDFNARAYMSYLGQYAMILAAFLVLTSFPFAIDAEATNRLMRLWVRIGCIASLLALAQRLSGELLIDRLLFIPYYDDEAVSFKEIEGLLASTAWFAEASFFGSFLVAPTLYVTQQIIRRETTFGVLARFSVLAMGVFLSYSLATMISLAVGLLALAYMSGRVRRLIVLSAFAAVALAFVDSSLIVARIAELYANLSSFEPGNTDYGTLTSFYKRSIGMAEGAITFLENPVFGVGLGQGHTPFHSGAITIAAELGLVGFALYYGFYLNVIGKLKRVQAPLGTFLIAALLADCANQLTTHHGFHPQYWILLSVAVTLTRSRSTEKQRYRKTVSLDPRSA